MEIPELKIALAEIEKRKEVIAKERDKLREVVYVIENLLDSFDREVEGLESGLREIVDAVDAVSEVV